MGDDTRLGTDSLRRVWKYAREISPGGRKTWYLAFNR